MVKQVVKYLKVTLIMLKLLLVGTMLSQIFLNALTLQLMH